MSNILQVLIAIGVILAIGISISFLFYNIKRRDLFGGFIGGLVIAVIGGLIGAYLLDWITKKIWEIFSNVGDVNVFAGLIGAYVTVYIMNKLNHDKERKKY